MDKRQALIQLGIEVGAQKAKYKTFCPECERRKGRRTRDKDLSVDPINGLYKCHAEKCNFQGAVMDDKYKRPEMEKPVANEKNAGLDYMVKERGISKGTLDKMKVYYCDSFVRFRYFKHGVYINHKDRNIVNKSFRQFAEAERLVYNYDSLHGKKKAIFVEGEIDVLTWVELGFDEEFAIISFDLGATQKGDSVEGKFKCIQNSAEALNEIEEFYLAGDNDEPGIYTMDMLADRLGKHRCNKVDFLGAKDSNALLAELKEDNRPTQVRIFQEIIKNAEPYPVGGITRLGSDLKEEILNELIHGEKLGVKVSIGEFSNLFSVYKGELTLWTGYPGDGKSTFLRNLAMCYAIEHGWKFACYVPEDNPASFFFKDMIKIYLGKQIDQKKDGCATIEEITMAMQFIEDHFFYIYPESEQTGEVVVADNKWINSKISYLRLKHNVNCYIKDPWNKIYHDITARDDQYIAAELIKEDAFAKSYEAAWYVVHPAKPARAKDGQIPMPTQYELAGGAMWNNAMYNIICIWRPERAIDPISPVVRATTLKIRKKNIVGTEGFCMFLYDWRRSRYVYEDKSGMMWPGSEVPVKHLDIGLDFDAPINVDMSRFISEMPDF